MEVIEFTIDYRRPDIFHFYPLGDIHYGAIECAENEVQKKVKEILNRKRSYVLGMGDYADCITKNDPRFDAGNLAPWVERTNIVESQREKVSNLFSPFAEAGKIIALGTGNHEEEIHARHDNDITRNICKDLNVPYAGYSCFVVLRFRRADRTTRTYIWHSWHGAGAAQTDGARMLRLMRLVNDVQADIYTMGHLHDIQVASPERLICRGGQVKSITLAACITGSWVKAYMQSTERQPLNPHYAEKKGYKPARIGCPVIHIEPDEDKVTVEA